MDTLHLPADLIKIGPRLNLLNKLIAERHAAGKNVVVTIADEDEKLSPQQAAQRLGFSRQHVMRLVAAGKLHAETMPGSSYNKIPLSSILEFEHQRDRARREADNFSASLDALGAPAE